MSLPELLTPAVQAAKHSRKISRISYEPISEQLAKHRLMLLFRCSLDDTSSQIPVGATSARLSIINDDAMPPPLPPRAPPKRPAPAAHHTRQQSSRSLTHRQHSGMLEKRGKHNTNWKKRWFLMGNKNLHYYKEQNARRPIGTIDLHDAIIRVSPVLEHVRKTRATPHLVVGTSTKDVARRDNSNASDAAGLCVGVDGKNMDYDVMEGMMGDNPDNPHNPSAQGRAGGMTTGGKSRPEYCHFEVVTPKRVFYLRCKNHNNMMSWIREMQLRSDIVQDNDAFDNMQAVVDNVQRASYSVERQIASGWSTLEGVLADPRALQYLVDFAMHHFNEDGLIFVLQTQLYNSGRLDPEWVGADTSSQWKSRAGTAPHNVRSPTITMLHKRYASTAMLRGPGIDARVKRAAAALHGFRHILSQSVVEPTMSAADSLKAGRKLFDTFVTANAPSELQLSPAAREQALVRLHSGDSSRTAFRRAVREVLAQLRVELFPSFQASSTYQLMMSSITIPPRLLETAASHFQPMDEDADNWYAEFTEPPPDTLSDYDSDVEEPDVWSLDIMRERQAPKSSVQVPEVVHSDSDEDDQPPPPPTPPRRYPKVPLDEEWQTTTRTISEDNIEYDPDSDSDDAPPPPPPGSMPPPPNFMQFQRDSDDAPPSHPPPRPPPSAPRAHNTMPPPRRGAPPSRANLPPPPVKTTPKSLRPVRRAPDPISSPSSPSDSSDDDSPPPPPVAMGHGRVGGGRVLTYVRRQPNTIMNSNAVGKLRIRREVRKSLKRGSATSNALGTFQERLAWAKQQAAAEEAAPSAASKPPAKSTFQQRLAWAKQQADKSNS